MVDTIIENAGPSKLGLIGVNFAINASLSAPIKIPGHTICGFSIPSTWTAANLTFQASYDNGTTYQNLYDDSGNEVTVTVAAASVNVRTDAVYWVGIEYLKVRSGTSGSPVAQTSALQVVLRTRQFS